MEFRLFLEAELPDGFYFVYHPNAKKWAEGQIGDRGTSIFGSRKKQEIDMEGIGRHNPRLGEILQHFVNQYPEVSNYRVRFDGPSVETVQQIIKRTTPEEYMGIPKVWYHGTSTYHLNLIWDHGIKPRGETLVEPSYQMGASPSHPDRVYLMDNDGNAVRFAAREASSKAKQAERKAGELNWWIDSIEPVVLKIDGTKLTKSKFRPDEDVNLSQTLTYSDTDSGWKKSLWGMGAVAYEGTIPPEAIEVHLSLVKNKETGYMEWKPAKSRR